MKNIIKMGLVGLVGVFMLTGCGSTFIKVAPAENYVKTQKFQADAKYLIYTSDLADGGYGLTHTIHNNTSRFILQGMALNTLKKGYRYFRILSPIDSSAVMITTPEELHKACFNTGMGDSIATGFSVTKYKDCVYTGGRRSHEAKAIYAVYKEKPNNALVINAQNFIDYLKKNKIYTTFDKIENVGSYNKLLKW